MHESKSRTHREREPARGLTPLLLATLVTVLLSVASPARAQGRDPVAAEAVFQRARALLEQGNVEEACPKFAESYRLDPATGTLLGLALCHEQEKKYASAWTEFSEAAGRARSEGQEDRASYAEERVKVLEPRLSTLSIAVPPEVQALPGLRVTRNGTEVGSAIFNTPVPIDGGEATVEVTATGKQTWKQTVAIEDEQARVVVSVPPLGDAPVDASGSEPVLSGEPATPADSAPKDDALFTPLQWTGIGVAGAGVVALGVGGYFLADALDKKSQSESDCGSDGCGSAGLELRGQAVDSGNLATAFGIGGLVLAGGGAALFFLAPEPKTTSALSLRHFGVASDGQGFFASARGAF